MDGEKRIGKNVQEISLRPHMQHEEMYLLALQGKDTAKTTIDECLKEKKHVGFFWLQNNESLLFRRL